MPTECLHMAIALACPVAWNRPAARELSAESGRKIMNDKTKPDATAGQVRRASDSRPRPGSGTPGDGSVPNKSGGIAKATDGEPKPSSSHSAVDPGRPVKR